MQDKGLLKKRKVEDSAENKSKAPPGVRTISQHDDSNVSTSTTPAATVVADTKQKPGCDSGGEVAGFVFMCNSRTKSDCFTYRVFGLPDAKLGVVKKIKPNTKLFLYDFDVRLLYGPYVADSNGGSALEPYAFGGKFSAQVKFSISEDCLPLPEAAFRDAIKENYISKSKFKQNLSYKQVNKLVSLFRPIMSKPQQGAFHSAEHHGPSTRAIEHSRHSGCITRSRLQHPSYHHVQQKPLLPWHSTHNQIARGGEDPYPSHPAYEYGSARLQQAYYRDDPGFQQLDTHVGYGYMKGGSPAVPPVPSARSYYGQNTSPLPTISHPEFQARTPSPGVGAFNGYSHYNNTSSTGLSHGHENQPDSGFHQTPPQTIHQGVYNAHASELPPAYGTAAAAPYVNQEYPNSQITIPQGNADPKGAMIYSNSTTASYGYTNEGYFGYHQAVPVTSDQVTNGHENHSASISNIYAQSQGPPSAYPQTLPSGNCVVDNAYSYHHQGYNSSHQMVPTSYQEVNGVPPLVSDTHLT